MPAKLVYAKSLCVRLGVAEHERILQAAQASGMTVSAWIRWIVIEHARRLQGKLRGGTRQWVGAEHWGADQHQVCVRFSEKQWSLVQQMRACPTTAWVRGLAIAYARSPRKVRPVEAASRV